NSCNVGGFQKICKNASIDDGNYDFVGIKKPKVFRLASLFFSIIKGKYERNKDIIYKQGKNFHIEFDGSVNPKFKSSDIDGNVGPLLPLQIQVLQQKIKFIYRQVK
ncbi:MAG: hypothetical protein RR334_03580, partial [Clostridia bacterium]